MLLRHKGDYFQATKTAWKRSKDLKLVTQKPGYTSKRYLTDENMPKLVEKVYEEFGVLGPKDVVQQCFGLHLMLRDLVSELFECESYYTLGSVELESGKPLVFHQSEDDIRGLLDNGLSGCDLNLHAWLTLPSMEILDFSLPTSLNVILGWNDIEPGSVVSGHADELEGDLRYHPMLIGEDFLRKIGALIEFRAV